MLLRWPLQVDELSELGRWIIATIGEPAARGLLDVLTRPEPERAALIGRLSQYEGATGLARLLIDMESDPEDITRLQVVEALRQAL